MCSSGQIAGATKLERLLSIQISIEKPIDGSMITDENKNWIKAKA